MGESNISKKEHVKTASAKEAAESLIPALISDNGFEREKARLALVSVGDQAVSPLVHALRDRSERMRWEAAKALGQIGSPSAAPALVEALEDNNFDVRWLSAEALVAIGRDGLEALLTALVKRPESLWLRDSAHHVLAHMIGEDVAVEHHLADHPVRKDSILQETLKPVVAAMHGSSPQVDVPLSAGVALDYVKQHQTE